MGIRVDRVVTVRLILLCPTTPELRASLHRLRVNRRTQSFAVTNTQRCAAVGGVCSVCVAILICIDSLATVVRGFLHEGKESTVLSFHSRIAPFCP